jgi:bifunctional DNA-binding transcriptional regulator/antitoxin component of YhaV-PrlF toxin-antitoxin module
VLVKTVKLSSKGQLTLPTEVVRALRAARGTEFVLVQDGERVLLIPATSVGKRALDELGGFEALGLSAFEKLWDNEADEIWNEA